MKKILVMLATITICAVAFLTTNPFAEATGNLWRCSRCNVQIQTSDTSKPRPGTCPYGNGHDWVLINR